MKLKIALSVAPIILSILNSQGFASEISEKTQRNTREMERLMVIGNSDDINNIAGSAQFIDLEALERYNYNDINRVLREVPGINIQEEEGYGNRPNIGIRGGRSERSADITLMEDGILIAPAPYAAPSAYYFPRVNRMEAIEVRKGSSTIKFGPRTTSGAVNMLSSSIPAGQSGRAIFGYGSDNTQRLELNYGDMSEKFSYVIDLGYESTDGFKTLDITGDDTGYAIADGMAKFRYVIDPNAEIYQHVEFKIGATTEDSNETYLGLTQADFESNPYRRYTASQRDNMDANHDQFQLSHYIEPSDNVDVTTTIYRNNFSRNWYKLQSVTIGNDKKSISNSLDDSAYLDALKGNTDLDGTSANNLTIRANNRDYYSEGIQSVIAHQYETKRASHEVEYGIRYHYDEEDRFQNEDQYSITSGLMDLTSAGAPGSNANRVGEAKALAMYVENEIDYGKLILTPGLRYESIKLTRNNRANGDVDVNHIDIFLPGFGAIYDLDDNYNLFASVHKGFAPPGPSTNTDQRSEESVNYEIGIRYNNNNLKTELVGFYNDYNNLLGEDTLSSSGAGTGDLYNGGEVTVYGIEAGLKYDLAAFTNQSDFKFPLNINYTFTSAEFDSSFTSSFDEWNTVTKGDELPYVPEHQLYVSIGVEAEKWTSYLSAKYMDEMRTVAGSGPIAYGSGTDDHFIIDVTAEYKLDDKSKLFASVYNLTDEAYVVARRPAGARPGAPLSILVGMKLQFN
ncbi:MAG: TonB-dependent receptor [Rickettsiales bacterium]|nr:TonB-dependent receptor [Rickettsiales bacterium]